MRDREITLDVFASPEGGFEAVARGHAIFTEGDSVEELKRMATDAVACHFDPDQRPRTIWLHATSWEARVSTEPES